MKPQLTLAILAALGLAAVAIVPFARHQAALAAEVEARAQAHAAIAMREREQAAVIRERNAHDPMETMIKALPEAERVKLAQEMAVNERARNEREKAEREAKARQARLVKLAHEAAALASEVGVAEVSGNPVAPAKTARLTELQTLFKTEGEPTLAAAIATRNATRIAQLLEGW